MSTPSQLTVVHRTPLFTAGGDGFAIHRIPVLALTARGTLIAAAEGRRADGGDWGEIRLRLRRSTDGGRTWSAAGSPAPLPADAAPGTVSRRRPGPATGLTQGNPVLIAAADGPVHLLWCLEYERTFHQVSHDDGLSWSTPVEITAALHGLRERYPWLVCATGPGHGADLGGGRLAVPVWLSLGADGHGHRPSVATTLLSDDRGATWRAGDLAVVDGGHASGVAVRNPSEGALAALPDGRVVFNLRSESAANRRLQAVSDDGGRTFSAPRLVPELFDAVCCASMVADGGRLWFAAPDPRDERGIGPDGRWGNHRDRRRLVLASSDDGGASWRHRGVIEAGSAGYSHLAVRDGRLWCLYEADPGHDGAGGAANLTLVEIAG